jgi:glycine cleavage system H protein
MKTAVPEDRLFSEEHEWVKINGLEATMGISDHAQSALGDVVYVELPEIGARVEQGKAIGVVESVKAVSDIFAPVSGVVQAFNQSVIDRPEIINLDPYGEGWLIKISLTENAAHLSKLLTPQKYLSLLSDETK